MEHAVAVEDEGAVVVGSGADHEVVALDVAWDLACEDTQVEVEFSLGAFDEGGGKLIGEVGSVDGAGVDGGGVWVARLGLGGTYTREDLTDVEGAGGGPGRGAVATGGEAGEAGETKTKEFPTIHIFTHFLRI